MSRRVMRALRGGESENLTQNYWTLRGIVLNKRSTEEDIYNLRTDIVPLLNDDELAFAYWELVYERKIKSTKEKIQLVKEYLLTEHMDRKYKRGEYKEVN